MTVSVDRPSVSENSDNSSSSRGSESRLAQLLDPGSMTVLRPGDDSDVLSVVGRIDGEAVVAYCVGAAERNGAVSVEGARRIVDAIDTAVRGRCPVVAVWCSGGVRLAEGVEALDGVGHVFRAVVRASGLVPQLSVVLGPCGGGVAYAPALTDIVVMAPAGRLRPASLAGARPLAGTKIDMVGSAPDGGRGEAHGHESGVAHVVAEDEPAAFTRARHLTSLLARPGRFDPDGVCAEETPSPSLRHILDGGRGRAEGNGIAFQELQPRWAPNMVVGLGRLAGRTVGALANNPSYEEGCLDSPSAEKAARFVRMCDALGVPLVVVVDAAGDLSGQEPDGMARHGATLLRAFAEAVVPRVTLVTRGSRGEAHLAMNSRSVGATAVFAWPDAEIAATGTCLVDEVIDPELTRLKLASALAGVSAPRGVHNNIPL